MEPRQRLESELNLPLISVVIPVYNEANNVRLAYETVKSVFDDLKESYRFEIVFTDNHSTDGTFAALKEIADTDRRVRVARFTRNFGFNRSLLTGYRLARGSAAIQLDCDLQDPPSLFPVFLSYWEKGHDVVVGIRKKREESTLLQACRKSFYRLLTRISEDNLVIDGGDFRLVDRSILDQLKEIYDATPYVRGLVSTISSNQIGVPYERNVRKHDQSKFPFFRLVGLAIDGIISHSTTPLRLASYAGLITSIATLLLATAYLVGGIFFNQKWPAGFTTQVILILFGIGLNATFLGIIGEYVGRIYIHLRHRPLTVIEKGLNLETPKKQPAADLMYN